MFTITISVRQGSVLSPVLFAIYVDNVAKCSKHDRHLHIILYADDIPLLALTVTEVEKLLKICEAEVIYLELNFSIYFYFL